MKILHLNSYYNTRNFYKNLYDRQKRNGLDISVYVSVSTASNILNMKFDDFTTISVNHGKYDRLFFYLKHNKIYSDIINQYKINEFSLMHAHSLFSNGYIAYKLNQKYNIPYVVAVQNTDINLFFKKIFYLRKIGIDIFKNANIIIFFSKPYKKNTLEKYIPNKYKKDIENKSIVIPIGIDKFWLENKYRERIRPKNNKIRLVYVGQINSNKNVETTIKACELLAKQGYEINFKVIGRIMHDRYHNLMKKYSFIQYIPHCPKEELINYYRDSDIFLMPSKHETFGLVYAEAMSQGLPVIYTREQGFDRHFKEGEVGYSVQYNSSNEIAQRIEEILNNYETISKNCIEKVDIFDWDRLAVKYEHIYKGIYNKYTKSK